MVKCYKCGKDTVQSFYVRLSLPGGKRTFKAVGSVCMNDECDFSQKSKVE
jgi:hypothetical protein